MARSYRAGQRRPVLRDYLRDIGLEERQYPHVSMEDEAEIGKRILQGDTAAEKEMIRSHLTLVVDIATAYDGRGVELPDLVEEGNLGLFRAARDFDYRKGFRFSTYATAWIEREIRSALANQNRIVRVPAYLYRRARQARDILMMENPDSLQREQALERMPPAMVRALEAVDRGIVDIEKVMNLGTGENETYASVEAEDNRRLVRVLVASLPEREQDVLRLRYGLDGEARTLKEVARVMGISNERVRQIQVRVLKKLRRKPAVRRLL